MSEPRPAEPSLAALIDRAFDYRGYVTVSRRDGEPVVGFVYDRGPTHVELFDETARHRIRLAVDQIADVALTGDDAAARAQAIWERRRGALEPADTPAWGAWEQRPVLILVALPVELRSVAAALGSKLRGATVRGRLGDASAVGLAVGIGGGAARAVAAERPRLVISCGFAGGLERSLATGDLVLASSVRDEAGESIAAAEPVLDAARRALAGSAQIEIAEGEILCTTQVAASAGDKRALACPGRLAVDLESWPAARAAVRAGVPWLALRVVVDPLDVDLPAFTRDARRSYLVPAVRHALRGPRAVVELADLARRARIAGRSLERALRRLDLVVAGLAGTESHP